jgi:hypothetical protein
MIRALALALALTACASAPRAGSVADREQEASIPFADFGGIRSFRPGPNRTLLLEGLNRKWYQATFIGPCLDIPYAETIGVITNPAGDVDRFSGVIVRGRRCTFRSLVEIPDPSAAAGASAEAAAEQPAEPSAEQPAEAP